MNLQDCESLDVLFHIGRVPVCMRRVSVFAIQDRRRSVTGCLGVCDSRGKFFSDWSSRHVITCLHSAVALASSTHCEECLHHSMLCLRGLAVLALSIWAPFDCVRGASSITRSTYSNDAAGATLAQSLAWTDLTLHDSSSNLLGVTPSDPFMYSFRLGGKSVTVVMKDWKRPWIPKAAFEEVAFEAVLSLPNFVSQCWMTGQPAKSTSFHLTHDFLMQATAPLPWSQQIWNDPSPFRAETNFIGTNSYYLFVQKEPPGPGLPFRALGGFVRILRFACRQFEDWVPQASIQMTVQTNNPAQPLVMTGNIGIVGAVGDVGPDSNSTSFLFGDI